MSEERAISIIKFSRLKDVADSKIDAYGETTTWSPENDQQCYWLLIYDLCQTRIDEISAG